MRRGAAVLAAYWYFSSTQERPTSWPAPSGVISTKLEGSSATGTSTVPRFRDMLLLLPPLLGARWAGLRGLTASR